MVYDAPNVQALRGDDPLENDPIVASFPEFVRAEIPVKNTASYRRYADILRNLANTLDLLGRRDDISERTKMMEMAAEVRFATQKMKQPLE